MNLKNRLLSLIVLVFLAISAKAQYDVHFAHFSEVENFYNPAAMNRDGGLNVVGSVSAQMVGYTHAPVSVYFGANTALPFDRMRHSLGAGLFNETIGLFTNRRILLDYAYKIGMGKGWMNIGVQGGVMNQEFNGTKVKAETSGDPAFPTSEEKGSTGDIGAGLLYVRNGWYAGISAQHLNFPHVEFGEGGGRTAEMDISPMLYLSGGCNIRLKNPLLSLQPCVLAMCDMDFFRTDLSLRCTYEYESALFYGGLSYSPGKSAAVLLGGRYREVLIGYAYEMYTGGVGYLNGSHDLVVSWCKDVDFFKRGRNTHKSVRYL
ncbi:MAG: PorP/SprF family type IX secretion system membrane protein [Bacteroidaceae bacterium]|nr:PorP/SprF family type IX secretion system membrane protein [Bacteroidaceae bacterium]